MRPYIKTVLSCVVVWACVGLSSCEKYLDKDAQTNISEKEAFKNFTNFQGFTEELYNCIVNFSNNYWTNSWNWGKMKLRRPREISTSSTRSMTEIFGDGSLNSTDGVQDG
ncbi:hypothetical protein [Arcticibacter sp. MXS-1]|uniref:hypothetical protein n=1 Tax=Arcticibacter sp. MXS-1 TaxID=3341726 RepID=UPI0035A97772